MQKILFVITKSNWGGAQRYVFDLSSSLPKAQWSVSVVLGGTGLPGAGGGRLEEELRHKDIRTIFVSSFMRDISLGAEWRALRELWDLFAKERPDVVHLNSSKAGGVGALAARLAGVPRIVFTAHGLPYDEDRNILSRGLIWFATWTTFLLCHRVITISQDNYRRAKGLPFCSKKIALIYNGIPELEYLPREDARERLGLPPGKTVIGALGEMTWNKNYHTLIRAAAELKRSGKDFLVCIIGSGEERHFIETLVQENELEAEVRLAGFLADGYTYLKAFDIFVLPSIKEGLPYVLLEAAQAGVPAVGSNIPGIVEILGEGGGLLVKPKDAKGLAEALGTLLDQPAARARFAAALHNRAAKEFTLPKMVAHTLRAYQA